MEVTNQVYPTEPGQIEELMKPGPEGPIVMVNLLKFRDKAEYPDGRETELSGREAYAIYGEAVERLVEDHGGRILFGGDVTHLTIGLAEELWDEVALVEYPNRGALVAMSMSEAYQEIGIHREAGLAGQLNIETVYSGMIGNRI